MLNNNRVAPERKTRRADKECSVAQEEAVVLEETEETTAKIDGTKGSLVAIMHTHHDKIHPGRTVCLSKDTKAKGVSSNSFSNKAGITLGTRIKGHTEGELMSCQDRLLPSMSQRWNRPLQKLRL